MEAGEQESIGRTDASTQRQVAFHEQNRIRRAPVAAEGSVRGLAGPLAGANTPPGQ